MAAPNLKKFDFQNRPPAVTVLPDGRLRVVRLADVTEAQVKSDTVFNAQVVLAYGTPDTQHPQCLLIEQAADERSPAYAAPSSDRVPWRLVFEQLPAANANPSEVQVGGAQITFDPDGRKLTVQGALQLSAASWVPGVVGVDLCPGDTGSVLLQSEANDNGAVRTIKRTYIAATATPYQLGNPVVRPIPGAWLIDGSGNRWPAMMRTWSYLVLGTGDDPGLLPQINTVYAVATTTTSAPASTLLCVNGGRLANNTNVTFQSASLSGITGLAASTVYYVVGAAGPFFQVSASPGGSPVSFTGSGTPLAQPQAPYGTAKQLWLFAHQDIVARVPYERSIARSSAYSVIERTYVELPDTFSHTTMERFAMPGKLTDGSGNYIPESVREVAVTVTESYAVAPQGPSSLGYAPTKWAVVTGNYYTVDDPSTEQFYGPIEVPGFLANGWSAGASGTNVTFKFTGFRGRGAPIDVTQWFLSAVSTPSNVSGAQIVESHEEPWEIPGVGRTGLWKKTNKTVTF